MSLLKIVCVVFVLALFSTGARAENYPTRPIHLIVPFTPGGGTDILARLVAAKLTEARKWSVIVENKPGAGGNIGVDLAAKSSPDGYTMVLGQTSNLAINPSLYRKLPYDPLKDLKPIALVASAPLVLVVSSSSPYHSLADVVAAAKAKPGKITFASPGNGTVSHLSGELLQRAAGIKMQHVPYRGAAPALTDLIGGRVNLFMSSVPTAIALIKGGKLRPLVVTAAKRIPELPQVPTIAEAGYRSAEAATWFGLLVPAATPTAITTQLNVEVNHVLQRPEVRQRIALEGAEVLGGTPAQFTALLKSEMAKWGQVVKTSGAKID